MKNNRYVGDFIIRALNFEDGFKFVASACICVNVKNTWLRWRSAKLPGVVRRDETIVLTRARCVGFAWPAAIWQTIVRAHAWRRRARKSKEEEEETQECTCTHTNLRAENGRVDEVGWMPLDRVTIHGLIHTRSGETSSPREKRARALRKARRKHVLTHKREREFQEIGIRAIPIVSRRESKPRTARITARWLRSIWTCSTFY